MQGSLLIMCIFWRMRQHRLRIDDFGNPLDVPPTLDSALPDGAPVQVAVEDALEGDVRAVDDEDDVRVREVDASEATPLLKGRSPKASGWRRLAWWR